MEAIVEVQVAVAALVARSIAQIAITQLVIVAHSTSAMTTTHSEALRAMEVAIQAVTLAADTLQVVAMEAVRADVSWYEMCITERKVQTDYEKDSFNILLSHTALWCSKGSGF